MLQWHFMFKTGSNGKEPIVLPPCTAFGDGLGQGITETTGIFGSTDASEASSYALCVEGCGASVDTAKLLAGYTGAERRTACAKLLGGVCKNTGTLPQ
jgi:hypothetical protein